MHCLARRWTLGAVGTLLLVCAIGSVVWAQPSSQAPTPRPGERSLFVSVLDKDGMPVDALSQGDFVVREDGMAREVVRAEKATEPVTIALVIDTSASAESFIPDMRRGLTAFVKTMGGKNPIALIEFGERPKVVTAYTLDVQALTNGVGRLFATKGAGAYMLEAVDEACRGLKKREFERGLVLVVTAGGPEFSERYYQDFLPIVRGCGSTVDVVSFDVTPPDLGDSGQRNREQFIDLATKTSGGARFSLLSSLALDDTLRKVSSQLGGQYRVTYVRPERLVPPDKTEVSVRQAGVTVRSTAAKGKQG